MEFLPGERLIGMGHPSRPASVSLVRRGIDLDTASDDPCDQFGFVGIDDPRALRHELVEAQEARGRPGDGVGAPASA